MGTRKQPGVTAMTELERIQHLCRHIERQIQSEAGEQPLSAEEAHYVQAAPGGERAAWLPVRLE